MDHDNPNPPPHNFIHIDPDNVCQSLRMCPYSQRAAKGYKEALMASSVDFATAQIKPTEDDLAALYFLYPWSSRTKEWGTRPLPLHMMTPEKLRALVERDHVPCDGCMFTEDYLHALLNFRSRKAPRSEI